MLLIQSSGGKGWVLPKGGWEADEATQQDAAEREAWEEAGIHCKTERDLGVIEEKRTDAQIKKYGAHAPRASYRFFEVKVLKEADKWPESHKRSRGWFAYSKAKELLQHRPELLEALEKSSINKSM